ncbi:putative transporter YycB [Lentilactobacillus hilgardii]|uniref:MFS transporter n=1 Tax=Lentilactobacillus hilgardii TaxID=1588 RepID=UPI00019C5429|nr:MFS transporter [Lentilactobacillus hilgardii]EEI21088.1 transporter, major facilitator family protein [Lentilactobacillus buchneri ATCC 11577]MCT3396171.1 MFS transporter [Lentilactobacillus hilgardii]QIR10661.1 putative transporter YycB [Lentilactobacillus hilgardii]
MNTKRQGINFTFEVFLLAANLRLAIIGIPPIVTKIQSYFHLTTAQTGVLTTIPLLCFGFLSATTAPIIRKLGTKRTIEYALLMLAIANLLRTYVNWGMFLGTIFVGAGITMLNVSLPALIVERHPEQSTKLNGVYTASINLLSAIVGGIAVPVANAIGWQFTVQLFSIPALIAFLGTLMLPHQATRPRKRTATDHQEVTGKAAATPIWKRGHVWLLAIFMGLQSLIFYTIVAWLPSVLTSHGLSATTAGLLFSIFQIIGAPFAYLVPRATTKASNLKLLMISLLIGYLSGIGILIMFNATWLLILACIIVGITTASIFTLSLSMITTISTTPQEAGSVGGIVQSIGYLIASVGPTMFGVIESTLGSWSQTLIILITISIINILVGFVLIKIVQKNHFVY